jgi:hypothetical protein
MGSSCYLLTVLVILIVAYFMLSGGTDRSGCDCVTDAEESRRSPLPLHLFPTFKL